MILEIIELALYFGRTLVTILHCTKIQAIRLRIELRASRVTKLEQSSKPSSSSSTNIEVVQPGRVCRPPAWAKVIGRMCALRPC